MINLAVVGFGWWGQHMGTRLADSEKVKVQLIVETDAERQELAKSRGFDVVSQFDDAIGNANIDAVILTSPNTLHEAQTIAAAKAGKHVFCEKPFALSAEGAKRSIEACKAAGVTVGVGHERRYEPAIQRVKELIDSGHLGTIMHAEAAFSHDKLIHVAKGDWRTMKATAPAAAMTGMGIHLTDLLISLLGRVDALSAFTSDRMLGWETGDTTTVQMKFKSGATATFSACLYTPHFIRLHIFGSKRWVEVINSTHPDTPGGIVDMTIQETDKEPVREQFAWNDTVRANIEAFADAIEGRTPYPFTHDQIVHNIEILCAIAKSADDWTVERFA